MAAPSVPVRCNTCGGDMKPRTVQKGRAVQWHCHRCKVVIRVPAEMTLRGGPFIEGPRVPVPA